MENIRTDKRKIVRLTVGGLQQVEKILEFEQKINAVAQNRGTNLLMDLSSLEYIRSGDLRVILKAIKKIQRRRGKVVICCLQGYVKEVFDASRFQEIVTITDSLDSGLRTLRAELEAA